jgi:poly(3-hydroxybutyrate) depolymerase
MLYQLHEWQHSSLMPVRLWAATNKALHGCPLNPFHQSPVSRAIVAGADVLLRTTRRYAKPEFGLTETTVAAERVAVDEVVVVDEPFCTLRHFRRDTNAKHPTVLVVAPYSGHHATLLRDMVRALLPEHDVFVTDWKDARMVPLSMGTLGFDDYVDYVRAFIRLLGPSVHVISVCQPTVPVLAAVSLLAADGERTPATMTMMGGPIDTRRSPTAVNDFATTRSLGWFEDHAIGLVPDAYPGRERRVCPGFFLLAGFVAMNAQRHFDSHQRYFFHLVGNDGHNARAHRQFYDEYNAVLDLPAEYYLDTIRMVFQEHHLPRGTLRVRGRLVEPSAIATAALFTIEGALDDISGLGQTQAAHDLCAGIPSARRQHLTVEGAGHYGIFSGRRYRESVHPRIRSFIREHDPVK